MKKIWTFWIFLFLPLVATAAQDSIKMVTYFPAPYVAYPREVVWRAFDVGLTAEKCEMQLGCSSTTNAPLDTDKLSLLHGSLYLNGKPDLLIRGHKIKVGDSNATPADRTLTFKKNLRVNKIAAITNLSARPAELTVTGDTVKVKSLKLFENDFPSCKAANSSSNGQMSWKTLSLSREGGNPLKGVFLTCGSGTQAEPCWKWVLSKESVLGSESTCTYISCAAAYAQWNGRPCNEGDAPIYHQYCCDGAPPEYMLTEYEVMCEKTYDCDPGTGTGTGTGWGSGDKGDTGRTDN